MANARRLFGIATAVAHVLLVFARAATDVGFNARAAVDVGLNDCPAGADLCGDPRMKGLRGQRISFSGTDGGWYCLFYDGASDIVVNVRLTAPTPEDFPDRQLVTGLSVVSEGRSLTIEVRDPRRVLPGGCPYSDVAPCLANGALRVAVDGEEADEGLLRFSRHEHVAGGISVSAANLPAECREFGADGIWARMYGDRVRAQRRLSSSTVDKTESFEAWIRAFGRMAALDWCVRASREAGTEGAASGGSSSMLDPPAQCLELGEGLLSFYESYGEGGFAGEPRRGGGGSAEGDDDARFEEWILSFGRMAAPDWCARYVAENGLADVQSTHAVFRISTPAVTIRLVVGVNHQAEGEVWEGRALPDLEFWQMNVGLLGAADLVAADDALPTISGLLGETARPVYDEGGRPIMEGPGAFRGAVEDYRVSDALGADFALLKERERRP